MSIYGVLEETGEELTDIMAKRESCLMLHRRDTSSHFGVMLMWMGGTWLPKTISF